MLAEEWLIFDVGGALNSHDVDKKGVLAVGQVSDGHCSPRIEKEFGHMSKASE